MTDFVRQPPIAYGYDASGNAVLYLILKDGEKARLMTVTPPKPRIDIDSEIDKEILIDLK
jgi:hypothetical protein